MKKEYNIGDKVWWVTYERQEVKKTCPICFGKKRVRIILGNESQIETDCTYCERGFQRYGYVIEYEYVSTIKQVEITSKEVIEDKKGRNVEYRYNNWCLSLDNISDSEEEAEKKLKEIIAKVKQEDLERTEHSKNENPRKYSWDVGYYQKQKKEALKTIERCDRKIAYFKAKVKKEKQK